MVHKHQAGNQKLCELKLVGPQQIGITLHGYNNRQLVVKGFTKTKLSLEATLVQDTARSTGINACQI